MYSRFGLKEEKDCFTVDCHEIKFFMSGYVKQAAFCSQRGDIDLNLISIKMQMFALMQICREIQIKRLITFPAF